MNLRKEAEVPQKINSFRSRKRFSVGLKIFLFYILDGKTDFNSLEEQLKK